MYNELRKEYREALLKLTSSLKTDGSDKIELARLFIRIGEDIILKNSSGSKDLKYYNDAAIHYTYAINISKKLLESQRNESTISLLQPIIAESEAKLKELHSIILDQITSDNIIGEKLETVKASFSLDEVSNKSYIYGLREYVNSRLQEINKYYGEIKDSIAYAAESTALFEEIAGRMKVYFTELLDSSTFIAEAAPCKYTILGLGSMTMRHMTPYSDLEFAILTEHDEYKTSSDPKVSNYFKNLSHYINFKVICLGETTIANSIYGLNLDDLGRRGINFDLGGKTSLGRSDKDYDLVCTVDQMLEYLIGNYPVTEERRRDDKLEHILENTCYICGNDGGYETSLLKEYQIRSREYLLSISTESRYTYCFDRGVKVLAGDIKEAEENLSFSAQTRGDLERFQFNPFKDEGKIFDVKQEVYRLPDRLIYNLGLIYGLTATANGLSDIEIIDGLLSTTIINEEAAIHLKETISYANMLRLRAYDFYGQQQETMDITPEGGLSLSRSPNFRISHNEVSEDGAFFRYYYTAIALHQYLTDFCEWQKRSLDTVLLTFEQIKSYFVDKSFYEPTSANKAIIKIRLLEHKGDIPKLVNICSKIDTRQIVDLYDAWIGCEGIMAFTYALKTNNLLININLASTKTSNEGLIVLSNAIKINRSIESIDLSCNIFGYKGLIALAEALKYNTSITNIDLSNNEHISGDPEDYRDEGLIVLSEALRINKSIKNINLSHINFKPYSWLVKYSLENQISDKWVIALAEALEYNTSITSIELTKNCIGDEGLIALSKALRINKTIQSINLMSNKIGNQGAIALSEALKYNQTLLTMLLGSNEIGIKGVLSLASCLKHNDSILHLYFLGQKFYEELGMRGIVITECYIESILCINQKNYIPKRVLELQNIFKDFSHIPQLPCELWYKIVQYEGFPVNMNYDSSKGISLDEQKKLESDYDWGKDFKTNLIGSIEEQEEIDVSDQYNGTWSWCVIS